MCTSDHSNTTHKYSWYISRHSPLPTPRRWAHQAPSSHISRQTDQTTRTHRLSNITRSRYTVHFRYIALSLPAKNSEKTLDSWPVRPMRKTTRFRPDVGFCLIKYPPKVMTAMFPHSQWSVTNTCLITHWDRVTHICVSKLTIIGSDNGSSPSRRQAIIWTNVGMLLIGPLGTNFSEILIEIYIISSKKMHLKLSSAKRWPFCLGHNVLRHWKWVNSFSSSHFKPTPFNHYWYFCCCCFFTKFGQ